MLGFSIVGKPMSHHADSGSAAATYAAGVAGVTVSGLDLNDWLLIFSIVLVLIRFPVEIKRLYDLVLRPLLDRRKEPEQ